MHTHTHERAHISAGSSYHRWMPHIGDKSQNRCRHSYVNTERGDHESAGGNTPLCSSPVRYTHPETMWGTVVCVCVWRGIQWESYVTNANPASPLMCVCVCACFVCVGGGSHYLGQKTVERVKSQQSVCLCVCVAPTIVSHQRVCVCVWGVSYITQWEITLVHH